MSAAYSPSSASRTSMRSVKPLDVAQAALFPDNTVINSRYTAYNFLLLNFYEQFKKPLNFYFLLVAMLQFVSVIAPVNPLSTLLPLLFAFSLTAAKEGYDDFKRHQQDDLYNNRRYNSLNLTKGVWEAKKCSEIVVGDVLKLTANEEIPCDVVCLAAPEESEGVVYIRTDNLDGEIDLKPREVVPILAPSPNDGAEQETFCTDGSSESFHLFCNALQKVAFVCPPPSSNIESFDARRDIAAPDGSNISLSLGGQHLLPQSVFLKNTKEAFVLAVYTGNETKFGMNKHDAPAKWANIDQQVSKYAKLIFVCQMVSALTLGLIGQSVNDGIDTEKGYWYLRAPDSEANASSTYLIYPLRFFLLTTVMIPVSFKFVVDLSKHFMALVLEWDLSAYNETTGEGIKVRNSSIVEDLGQIQFVLSDKTGTMTQNSMILRHLSVDNTILDVSGKLKDVMVSAGVDDFLVCALLCNTVEVEGDYSGSTAHHAHSPLASPPSTESLTYHAASPDEEAICRGVGCCGYFITHRNKNEVVLHTRGVQHVYRIHRVFGFTSEKKCMAVVVEPIQSHRPSAAPGSPSDAGSVRLIVKGADDRMFSFCGLSQSQDVLKQHLVEFAHKGLRTLVFGSKWLSRKEFDAFQERYVAAMNMMEQRKQAMDALELELEEGIEIVGGTAIEDKLQESVEETIADLIEANVRVWMLTGDKIETAEQIALSCGLISADDTLVRITENGKSSWEQSLRDITALPILHTSSSAKVKSGGSVGGYGTAEGGREDVSDSDVSNDALMPQTGKKHHKEACHQQQFAVLVQGGAVLDKILHSAELLANFRKIALVAKSVVCARVTPSQKAQVTELVRGCGFITLAIGDGGNDVAMIQQAHVGVGITGKEGTQASRAADFTITKFSHLRSLMFVHGHSSYARTAYVVQYSFYKSMLISFIQLVFNVVATKMSGASFWNSFALTMWNGVYTLPQTLCYCLDRAAPRNVFEGNPVLYRQSQQSFDLNRRSFFAFVARGILQSVGLYFLVTGIIGGSFADPRDGSSATQDVAFTIAYSALMLHQLATVVFESHSITIVNAVVIIGMPLFYYLTVYAYASVPRLAYFGTFQRTDNWSPGFVGSLGIAAALFLPHMLVSSVRSVWWPNARSVLRHKDLAKKVAKLQMKGIGRVTSPAFALLWSLVLKARVLLTIVDEDASIYVVNKADQI